MNNPTTFEHQQEVFDIHRLVEKLEDVGEREVKVRTIHYYAAKDLLKPIGFGRNAKYSMIHVYRYKMIRLLQQQNLSLDQIRIELDKHTDFQQLIDECERLIKIMTEQTPNSYSMNASQKFETHSYPEENYSHQRLFDKVTDVVFQAGVKVIYAVLLLYHVLLKSTVNATERIVIVGALSYFILVPDAVPDILPGLGFTDDFGALIAAIIVIKNRLDSSVLDSAKCHLNEWFAHHRNLDKELLDIERHFHSNEVDS